MALLTKLLNELPFRKASTANRGALQHCHYPQSKAPAERCSLLSINIKS